MKWPATFIKIIESFDHEQSAPLKAFSTIKVGGPARYVVRPQSLPEIATIERACFEYGIDLHIISGGSNTLFSDSGFDGVVMKLGSRFDEINLINPTSISVSAATSYARLTKLAVSLGWPSAVGWTGTPGLVGGALRMNAGTRMGEISDVVLRIHGVQEGKIVCYERSDLQFFYRASNLPANIIISGADLAIDKNLLKSCDELLEKVKEYRLKRKLTQPTISSLGSFFKNPYPHFAAQLIEKCKLKGLEYKGAQISSLHANFIVNNGGATAHDILYIASIAQKNVFERFGVVLQPEIRMAGNFTGNPSISVERLLEPST